MLLRLAFYSLLGVSDAGRVGASSAVLAAHFLLPFGSFITILFLFFLSLFFPAVAFYSLLGVSCKSMETMTC